MGIMRVNPKATFRLICESDEAIQHESADELAELLAAGKPTRYERYSESLEEKDLVLKEGVKPDYFTVRCLKNSEFADIQGRHMVADTVNKKVTTKNASLMFLEIFNAACIGVEDGDGKTSPITSDELPFGVATSIGATIFNWTAVGKQLKKS